MYVYDRKTQPHWTHHLPPAPTLTYPLKQVHKALIKGSHTSMHIYTMA